MIRSPGSRLAGLGPLDRLPRPLESGLAGMHVPLHRTEILLA
jgi:hypothetical protein